MAAEWRKGCSIDKFAARLETSKIPQEQDGVKFEGFQFRDCSAVLYNLIDCKGIPEGEKRRIVTQAIFNAGAKGGITPDTLLVEIRELEILFWKQAVSRFVLCTSLSIDRFSDLRLRKLDRIHIKFLHRLPKSFEKGVERIREISEYSLSAQPPDDYIQVLISVDARSPVDAAAQAFEAIDLLRGIWNFGINRRHINRNSYGDRKPVNEIVMGPLHSLHLPDGKLATEMWWYDPEYQKPVKPLSLRDDRDKLRLDKIEQSGRTILKKHNYRNVIESGIKEYCRALDHRNWSNAFLKLWSVLELLTHTEKENYGVTIRRASFVWTDAEYHREVLNHLRHLRNSFVHENKSTDDVETYMYQLKLYVEALINFHLGRGLSFSSISESAEFMDLPIEQKVLRKKMALFDDALKFRKFQQCPTRATTGLKTSRSGLWRCNE